MGLRAHFLPIPLFLRGLSSVFIGKSREGSWVLGVQVPHGESHSSGDTGRTPGWPQRQGEADSPGE